MRFRAVGHTDNSVFIDADIDLVWDVTNDVTAWPELFAEYASVEILNRDRETVRFRLCTHPDDAGEVSSWVSERTLDRRAYRAVERRIVPGPFEFIDTEWQYVRERMGTRLRWVEWFRMRPTAPLDDVAMTERVNSKCQIYLEGIRRKVERAAGAATRRAT